MRMIVSVGVLASALLNGVALAAGRGSFIHWFAVMVIATYVGVPALVIGACSYFLRNRFLFAQRLARVAALVAVVSASTLVSLIPGRELVKGDIAAAKKYCESLIPEIDEYQRAHGAYPLDISLIPQSGEVPRLLRGSQSRGEFCQYWSDGSEFSFNFGDPRGIMNFIGYNSHVRRWSEWH